VCSVYEWRQVFYTQISLTLTHKHTPLHTPTHTLTHTHTPPQATQHREAANSPNLRRPTNNLTRPQSNRRRGAGGRRGRCVCVCVCVCVNQVCNHASHYTHTHTHTHTQYKWLVCGRRRIHIFFFQLPSDCHQPRCVCVCV
jgi:hypothetical protein